MDLDAILARRPQVALVDELAHTNVPGSRNEKRWQDVEELLAAGIGVISTLNIQHLESLNDVVEQITAVPQQETIPDEVVRRADELQLVDLTPRRAAKPARTRRRLPAERIDAALANYFRPRQPVGAARARAALARRPGRRGPRRVPRAARHRRAVGDAGARARRAHRLVRRRAARPARRPDRAACEGRSRRRPRACRRTDWPLRPPSCSTSSASCSKSWAARYHEVVAEDVGEALVEAARSLNATQIVMGASRRSRWQRLTRGSVIGKVIRESGVGIDVHVISHPEASHRGRVRAAPAAPARHTAAPARAARARARRRRAAAARRALLAQLRDERRPARASCCSSCCSSSESPPSAASGRRSPPRSTASCSSTGTSRRPSTPSRSARARTSSRSSSSSPSPAIVSGFVALAARRAAEAARTRAEAEALARLAGSSPVVDRARGPAPRARPRRGRSAPPRQDGGWRIEAASGDRAPESPEAASTTLDLDAAHVLALAGHAASGARTSASSTPSPGSSPRRSSSASSRPRSRPPAPSSAANELRTAILSAVSHDLRTPICGDQGVGHEPAPGRHRVDARSAARVPRHDRRGDRPPRTPSSATCST